MDAENQSAYFGIFNLGHIAKKSEHLRHFPESYLRCFIVFLFATEIWAKKGIRLE